MSQVYVTGLACGASDVTGLCHRFGMWCVRCHRFMSQVWHVVRQMSQVYVTGLACVRQMSQVYVTGLACVMASVRQMSQVYVTGLACGASDVTGLCHRFGMWCVRCHRFMSQVWHVMRQMSQVYVTGLACDASDVTGLCHRFGMWCVRCHRFMSQVWHVCVRCHRFMSQVWHVSWRLCVRCHGVRASDVMSHNVKTASRNIEQSVTRRSDDGWGRGETWTLLCGAAYIFGCWKLSASLVNGQNDSSRHIICLWFFCIPVTRVTVSALKKLLTFFFQMLFILSPKVASYFEG